MKTVHVTIHGRVHGVGFRQFVKSNAVKLGIVGWVQNNDSDLIGAGHRTVEAMLQGEEKAVDEMIALCKIGPMLSEIKKIDVNQMQEPFNFKEFEVL